MSLWFERMIEMHYQDLKQEAERSRLAHQALEGRRKNRQLYCRALSWLGSHLYIWGNHLLEHYGTAPKTTVLVRKHSG